VTQAAIAGPRSIKVKHGNVVWQTDVVMVVGGSSKPYDRVVTQLS